jgi:uncharacterized protein (TIGR00369 family)
LKRKVEAMTQEQKKRFLELYCSDSSRPGYGSFLGHEVSDVHSGAVSARFVPGSRHMNGFGATHGGTIAGLIDSVGGLAAMTTLKRVVTSELNVSYIRPSSENQELMASAMVVHSGRNLVRVSAEVSDTNGKLIATGNLTFFVVGELDL